MLAFHSCSQLHTSLKGSRPMGRDANILFDNFIFVLDHPWPTVLWFSHLHSYLNILKDHKFSFFFLRYRQKCTKNVQNSPEFSYNYPKKIWEPSTGLLLYSLETSENLKLSDAFMIYRKRPVAWGGLTCIMQQTVVQIDIALVFILLTVSNDQSRILDPIKHLW